MSPDSTNKANTADASSTRRQPSPGGDPVAQHPPPLFYHLGLGPWGLYFTVKLFLYWKSYIGFHALENLAFAMFLMLPTRRGLLRTLRNIVALPVGIALFYHDTWLPSPRRVLSQLGNIADFSTQYLIELVSRFIDLRVVSIIVILWVAYVLMSRYIRIGVLVFAALLVLTARQELFLSVTEMPTPRIARSAQTVQLLPQHETPAPAENNAPRTLQETLSQELDAFHRNERQRSVILPADGSPPFDLLFIHVCSLSWDDLEWAGLKEHPLLGQFDILFSNFNTASSYSGPAAIRMLRAGCGQPAHKALYKPAPAPHCYLFENLRRAGFDTSLALNHDGRFDDFLGVVRKHGGWRAPLLSTDGIAIRQRAFDGTPVRDDLQILERWLQHREDAGGAPVATYYNTVSLHDGNRLNGEGADLDSRQNYALRLRTLMDDLYRFFQELETSNRNVVVVLVPEHGAAIRGDAIQIAGLREIPSPAITLVPVGIRAFGPGLKRGAPVRIDAPTSYLAVTHIVRQLLLQRSYQEGSLLPGKLVEELPETPFVSEHDNVVMMRRHSLYYLRMEDGRWMPY